MKKKEYSSKGIVIRVIGWILIFSLVLALVFYLVDREKNKLALDIIDDVEEKWALIQNFSDDQESATIVVEEKLYEMVIDDSYKDKHNIGEVVMCYLYDDNYYGTKDLASESNLDKKSFIKYYLLLVIVGCIGLFRIILLISKMRRKDDKVATM